MALALPWGQLVTFEMGLVFAILAAAFLLLVTEWVRMDLVALLVLGALALTGLVTSTEALSGFSSPAVVTVWAVFILSAGLTKTGVAKIIGRQVLRLAGEGEARLIVAIMLTAGLMSAFLNNVGVAALLLPVVMDVARRTRHSPSRLLMPLAFGSLLGGLTTLIGTPPNILVNDVMHDFSLPGFRFFDFTPVGGIVLLAGIAYMALIGRHLLPKRDITQESARADLSQIFDYQARMCVVQVPPESELSGRTLADSRLGAALGLNVLAILRDSQRRLAPGPSAVLEGGDTLIVEGRLDRLYELSARESLQIDAQPVELDELTSKEVNFAELRLAQDSPLVGQTLLQSGFRHQFGVNILAIRHNGELSLSELSERPLSPDDGLLVQATRNQLKFLNGVLDFRSVEQLSPQQVRQHYRLDSCLLRLSIPSGSNLAGQSLEESHLGDGFGLSVLGIHRNGSTMLAPQPDVRLMPADELLVEGQPDEIETLHGLRQLIVDREATVDLTELESAHVGLEGVVLSPGSSLDGKTLRGLHFREKYGLTVLAIWRGGRPYRSNLRDMPLRFGDALLLYGGREKLRVLGIEPDFLVLTEAAQEAPRLEKAWLATLIMAGVLAPAIVGAVPIAISGIVGATVMVMTGCLTMDEAYRNIDWRAVFLIAGMLPLGIAMQQTGAAAYLAQGVVQVVGPLGTIGITAGLFLLTAAITQVMPTPAVVVLMLPIAISTGFELSLSPQALAMVVAVAAAACSLNPVSHPANSLVMGPGGYRFSDFLKVGLPLIGLILLIVLFVLPVFWPY